jgi:hypothetical protein
LALLKEKHPVSHPESSYPSFVPTEAPIEVTTTSVTKAIQSFPSGSAGGHDGLLPQHLKDLIFPGLGEVAASLIASLTRFINQVISGCVPTAAQPFFFGARLIGLNKADGGIRPIAIGCTLRRLAAKCLGETVKAEMGALLFPFQLGFGTPMGAEATVHAARSYLSGLGEGNLMLKLDFQNAFNSIRRDAMLYTVKEKAPTIFPLAFTSYHQPSLLFHGDYTIDSCEGVQQGDPLGPLLFCLAIHHIITSLKSDFKVFYLDDGTLGGSLDDVHSDLLSLEEAASHIGLVLNRKKSECICMDTSTQDEILLRVPSLHTTPLNSVTLLGSPIGGSVAIEKALATKVSQLEILGERLKALQAHDALCLLRNAFSLPKLLYVLRTAPCFGSQLLSSFDDLQRSLLESICNIHLSDSGWLQASLPVSSGGLGVRSAVMLAPSAFLASAAGSASISQTLLPDRCHSQAGPIQARAIEAWTSLLPTPVDPPSGIATYQQKCWDTPVVEGCFTSLLSSADSRARARLLAGKQKESGSWLSAPPVSALGLRMTNDSIRIAVGLRLGAPLCIPHNCPLCGNPVDYSGVHGLSCRSSRGRIPRHTALNGIVHRALATANVPATLEPRGLCRGDGKRPDGMSITPWFRGKTLGFIHPNKHQSVLDWYQLCRCWPTMPLPRSAGSTKSLPLATVSFQSLSNLLVLLAKMLCILSKKLPNDLAVSLKIHSPI